MRKYILLAVLVLLAGSGATGAPLFTSNFDLVGEWQLDRPTGTVIDGWTVTTGAGVDWIGSLWTDSGARTNPSLSGSIDLNALGPGGLSRTLGGLTPGGTYRVSFYLAGNPFNGSTYPTLQTGTLNFGSSSQALSFNAAGRTPSNMGWIPLTYNFVATASTQNLSFLSTDAAGDPNGLVLDGVSVEFVNGPPPPPGIPEPGTMAMIGGGLAGLAFLRHRRR
jgi:hypothetical protein